MISPVKSTVVLAMTARARPLSVLQLSVLCQSGQCLLPRPNNYHTNMRAYTSVVDADHLGPGVTANCVSSQHSARPQRGHTKDDKGRRFGTLA